MKMLSCLNYFILQYHNIYFALYKNSERKVSSPTLTTDMLLFSLDLCLWNLSTHRLHLFETILGIRKKQFPDVSSSLHTIKFSLHIFFALQWFLCGDRQPSWEQGSSSYFSFICWALWKLGFRYRSNRIFWGNLLDLLGLSFPFLLLLSIFLYQKDFLFC